MARRRRKGKLELAGGWWQAAAVVCECPLRCLPRRRVVEVMVLGGEQNVWAIRLRLRYVAEPLFPGLLGGSDAAVVCEALAPAIAVVSRVCSPFARDSGEKQTKWIVGRGVCHASNVVACGAAAAPNRQNSAPDCHYLAATGIGRRAAGDWCESSIFTPRRRCHPRQTVHSYFRSPTRRRPRATTTPSPLPPPTAAATRSSNRDGEVQAGRSTRSRFGHGTACCWGLHHQQMLIRLPIGQPPSVAA
ncbi:hypothetical protein M409DRAFT_53604 [Zasmidium cellare ATCC 36951]|uniref:Uncharacterized protein n=1 Tax=Zasmidium cellare ATCC 36951 TaxID=1080233 RepID=A0A6A6CM66_ZASCE|nr:uncharacterized protein M409DRAFT_53604 [Zasmidium cellare ATCC 36951]KAF2168327.1 hypothetical protein M409DRAFT_53604 [Zasmidium cellare ATCC 36951]